MADAARVFAALGDEVRLKVVTRLSREGPLSIARLADDSGVTRQAVTKHLRVLEEVGLVKGKREGRENVYELLPVRLQKARAHLESISNQWDDTLGRLADFLED